MLPFTLLSGARNTVMKITLYTSVYFSHSEPAASWHVVSNNIAILLECMKSMPVVTLSPLLSADPKRDCVMTEILYLDYSYSNELLQF